MGEYYRAMTNDMGGKLSGYYIDLQSRYGDPRVYAAQRQQMQQQEAAIVHSQASRTSDLLRDAYAKKQSENRSAHSERMSKRRGGHTASSPPESAGASTRQTAPPRKPRAAQPRQADPSAS